MPSDRRARHEGEGKSPDTLPEHQIVGTADNTGDRTPTDWLTTGEAYQEAVRRGLTLEETTFRNIVGAWRRSKPRKIPKQLEWLGLQEDFDSCPNPKAKTNRWLKFQ